MHEKTYFTYAIIVIIAMFIINITDSVSYEYTEKVHHIECDDEYIISLNKNVDVSFVNCTKEYNYWVCDCDQSDVYIQREWGNLSVKLSIDYYVGNMVPENHKNVIIDINKADTKTKRKNMIVDSDKQFLYIIIWIIMLLIFIIMIYLYYKKKIIDNDR